MQFPKSLFVLAFGTLVLALIVAGCGGGSNSTSGGTTMATVQASISDPATCDASVGGTYQHVYITVTDVQISQSTSDTGWVDLAPGMAPKQIDLLGNPSNQCFLAQLGAQQIPAGTYEQIRIMLLANNQASQLTTNACGANAANCVVLADNSVHTLQLSSEAQTGLKIPSGQIAGGDFTVAPGSTVDLNIDFNACMSIVKTGNNQYKLKPVLHAGEVSLQTSSITGTVVDSGTLNPIVGAVSVVALEQRDATGVDRVIMQTLADPTTGTFTFCPVPTGTYDVVVTTLNGTQSYAATVTTGVAQGTAIGKIPVIAVTGTNTGQGSITGQITSAGASGGVAVDVTVSATQSLTINSQATLVIIPLPAQSTASAIVSTASDVSCPASTFCASYTVAVPAANSNVGAFNSSGTTYTQDTVNPNTYTVDGQAFQQAVSTPTLDCTPSDVQVNTLTPSGPITVVAGGPAVTASTMTFTGCQ